MYRHLLILPDGTELTAEGYCEGNILFDLRGTGGFGYDPVFYVPVLGKTFAEAGAEEKNAISHRGKAMVKFRKELVEYYSKI